MWQMDCIRDGLQKGRDDVGCGQNEISTHSALL